MIALLAEVLVLTQMPGATAPEIERQVTIQIEQALGGLGTVESRSVMGLSEVRVQTDARMEVLERLQRVRLPPGVQSELAPPVVPPSAWMRYTVASEQFSSIELRTLQDWEIRRSLLMVPGVGDVATCGGRVARINIHVDPQRLAALKLSLTDIRSPGDVHEIRDLEQTMLDAKRGVRLRDVAMIEHGAAPVRCLALLDGKEVVVGMVQPRIGSRPDAGASTLAKLRATLPYGVTVQPFVAAQEIQLRFATPIARDELGRVREAILQALPGPALLEIGSPDDREESIREARVLLRNKGTLKPLPPEIEVVGPASVRVLGPDLAVLAELATKLGGHAPAPATHLAVEPDRDALARFGLSPADLALHVEAACIGRSLGMLSQGERRIDIVLRLHDACKDLSALTIGKVPLKNVARLRQESVPAEIRRAGGVRFIEVHLRERPDRAQIARSIQLPVGYSIVIP